MTYKKLYEIAEWKLEHGELTLGEFDEMTKPLDEEIRAHGEWSSLEYGYKCSVCTAAFYTHSNFCPNCGADMREGEAK